MPRGGGRGRQGAQGAGTLYGDCLFRQVRSILSKRRAGLTSRQTSLSSASAPRPWGLRRKGGKSIIPLAVYFGAERRAKLGSEVEGVEARRPICNPSGQALSLPRGRRLPQSSSISGGAICGEG